MEAFGLAVGLGPILAGHPGGLAVSQRLLTSRMPASTLWTIYADWQSPPLPESGHVPHYGDIAKLDRDHDLIACESLP